MDLLRNNTARKRNLVLYFQVHQPKRLSSFRFFDIGTGNSCFDEELDRDIVQRVSRQCYLPTNELLLRLIEKHPQIKVTFSLSGVIIDQLNENAPEVLESFRELAATGNVEFLGETYYHSLSCMIPGKEFELQAKKHAEKIYEHFGVYPTVFRNTELIYNDEIGQRVSRLGFKGMITDGIERILNGRSPNHVFQHPDSDLKVLLRNYRLSDDIAFRFAEDGKALTADKYINWLNAIPAEDEVVNLSMDYETFGEHQKKESGIFKFLEDVLVKISRNKHYEMAKASEVIANRKPKDTLKVPNYISWADNERDLSAWLGNEMQRDAFDSLLKLEYDVKNLGDEHITELWRNLQISDHFYYMSTKKGSDGNVHSYFSPYPSPYEAFINYMNVLTDFSMRVKILRAGKMDDSRTTQTTIHQQPQSAGMRMTMLAMN